MKLPTILRATAVATTLAFSAFTFAADVDHNANANDVAIQGYDTVSYFTPGAPVKGSSDFTATYKNAIYQFSSAENRDAFKQDPAKYAPQYGGFCAFGVTMNRKFDTDPLAFKIVDEKLYLNLNSQVQERWLTDVDGFINTAEQNWGGIKAKPDSVLAE
ncbi:YHS domain-containing (seleno)protein [Alteromonas sp. W364]|uniref:YHS domain-containing (seleno)protein n=1 Tax=Alteromonas sp. W364 TaxID=3075610 RepID=UPI0028854373|nr:YHS domain-containing (seleno)protein [Alteromonas sp. W364]MDT0629441.1 YHS domain-containing (seleno)protein [Alteromonas sp. W364]